jgi:hypothetical protein
VSSDRQWARAMVALRARGIRCDCWIEQQGARALPADFSAASYLARFTRPSDDETP